MGPNFTTTRKTPLFQKRIQNDQYSKFRPSPLQEKSIFNLENDKIFRRMSPSPTLSKNHCSKLFDYSSEDHENQQYNS